MLTDAEHLYYLNNKKPTQTATFMKFKPKHQQLKIKIHVFMAEGPIWQEV